MTVTCPTCHLSFCDDVASDRRTHRTRHERFLRAAFEGIHVRSYCDREAGKTEAWSRLNAASTDLERLDAMEEICRCHFERSIEPFVADGTWSKHPDYRTYAAGYAAEHVFGEHAPLFRRVHPRRTVEGLPPGMTEWVPPRRATRRPSARL